MREQRCTGVFQSCVEWTLWDQEQGLIAWECKLQTLTQGKKGNCEPMLALPGSPRKFSEGPWGVSLVYSVFHPFLILQVRS